MPLEGILQNQDGVISVTAPAVRLVLVERATLTISLVQIPGQATLKGKASIGDVPGTEKSKVVWQF